MRLRAAFLAAVSIVLDLPAAAQDADSAPPPGAPATSINIVPSLHDYQIDGWRVRCAASGSTVQRFDDCVARKSFGAMPVTIRVGDDHLLVEVVTPCLAIPRHYWTRTWDRRQPIQAFDAARAVAAVLDEKLVACRQEALPREQVYEFSSLMFLLLQAVPIPAYVQYGIGSP